ncbi:hypothetical protein BJV82DRAFT_619388 [Fennellomyces sp. T-0311]|nr:hypothetical protein BJV82DRAFT_619388 [Fennellomyces sp. T-0311]
MTSNTEPTNTNERIFEMPSCLLQVPLTTPYNQELVDLFRLLDAQLRLGTNKRQAIETQWSRTIAIIKAQKCKVDYEYAKRLGIPEELCDMIKVYDKTGTIAEATDLLTNEEFNTVQNFENVYGVGLSTAKKWWNIGYRSLDDVMNNARNLSEPIRQAIHITSDLRKPIFREDAEEIECIIGQIAKTIDQQATVSLVGSYQRGKVELGDIDILLRNHSGKFANSALLSRCIETLSSRGLIKLRLLELTIPKKKKSYLHASINTVAVNATLALIQPTKRIVRQVDMRVVSESQATIMQFMSTGSARFLHSLINLAKSKGFKLSPTGMLDKDNKQLLIQNEKDIFKYLNIEYIEPHLRHH